MASTSSSGSITCEQKALHDNTNANAPVPVVPGSPEMKRLAALIALSLLAALLTVRAQSVPQAGTPAAAATAAPTAPSAQKARQLSLAAKPWKGDFDGMLERRVIRAYVPYSRTLYFIDKGRERGAAADLMRQFERWVNKKHAKALGKRPLTLVVVPATRDKLLADLTEGRADIALGNIKVLDELLKSIDFVAPEEKAVSTEILVTGPKSPAIASLDDLSGKTVHVRKVSSYYLSLIALNDRLKAAGKPEVRIVPVPDALEDEDILEMLNAGLLEASVVDDWKAKMWAQVLTKVKVRDDIVLRPPIKMGWAIRKGSPKLAAELDEFYRYYAKTTGGIPALQRQYMKSIKTLNNAASAEDQKRFMQLIVYFQKYGSQYHFDPIMLAAQGYQESTLDQNVKSPVGAVGVMQVMPATGAELKVGDIRQAEPNIHAGAKYMDQLMTRYFSDANFDEQNRTLFAFASYNAGPGNIAKMRKEAVKRGLAPDVWFNNVEIVTAEKIGMETTTYVRNIYKYYAAYKLVEEARATAEALKQQVAPTKERGANVR
jgi:membrane-bound lytic murein transglycosylase MltF